MLPLVNVQVSSSDAQRHANDIHLLEHPVMQVYICVKYGNFYLYRTSSQLCRNNRHRSRMPKEDFRSVRNILRMHWSMNDDPSSTSTKRFSKLPNHALKRNLTMPMKREQHALYISTLRFDIGNCSAFISLMDSFQVGGRRCLSTLKCGRRPFQVNSHKSVRRSMLHKSRFIRSYAISRPSKNPRPTIQTIV